MRIIRVTGVLTSMALVVGCSRASLSGGARAEAPSNTILAVVHGRTQTYSNINQAFSGIASGGQLVIGPGLYTAGYAAVDARLHGRKDVSVTGVDYPVVYSEFHEASGWCRPFNAEGGVQRLRLSGIAFVNEYRNYNNRVCYGSTFNGDDIVVSDCYFWSVLQGSNCVFKNWATGSAGLRNRMIGGGLITVDASGSNDVYHIAFHGGMGSTAQFINVMMLGGGLRDVVVGNAVFSGCTGNLQQVPDGVTSVSADEASRQIKGVARRLGLPDQMSRSAIAVFDRQTGR